MGKTKLINVWKSLLFVLLSPKLAFKFKLGKKENDARLGPIIGAIVRFSLR